jgi:uncharacterized protein (TIGR00730 family)
VCRWCGRVHRHVETPPSLAAKIAQMRRICVFCGSSAGIDPRYARAAEELGRTLAKRRIGIVFGGGRVGMMGHLADSALAKGGDVIGVIPDALMAKELGHRGITKLHIVNSMHERKALMASLSDAFLALPGGFGTFEEFCEAVTWTQLGLHAKACGLLNVGGYFDPLLALFDHATREGFIAADHREIVIADKEIGRLLDRLMEHQPLQRPKWIDEGET